MKTKSRPKILFEFLKVSYVTKAKVYLDGIDFELFILNFDSLPLALFKMNNNPDEINLKVVFAYNLLNKATHIVGW